MSCWKQFTRISIECYTDLTKRVSKSELKRSTFINRSTVKHNYQDVGTTNGLDISIEDRSVRCRSGNASRKQICQLSSIPLRQENINVLLELVHYLLVELKLPF